MTFYPAVVPPAVGWFVIIAAVAGIVIFRRERGWTQRLLVCWIVVPVLAFELWPVKGFQYLLPAAPAIALLAARTLVLWSPLARLKWRRQALATNVVRAGMVAVVVVSLAIPSWNRIQPSTSGEFLAGSGGVPGGREAGAWIRDNVPENALFLAIGPSMANIIQFYGHRKAYGLSVSPNPLHRNPSYEAIVNPDSQIRNSDLQYLVYDSFSAARSPFFGQKLLSYVQAYHGRIVHTESITVTNADGTVEIKPLIVIYEVRP
jgi:4-amino-4-deoxy-L-arabinose transferase-like glycosyltransferase